MEKHTLNLKNPELHTSPEVELSVKLEEKRAVNNNKSLAANELYGPPEREKIPNDPKDRIDAYIRQLEDIFLNPDIEVRKQNIERRRQKIYDSLLIKRENFPESYFELQQRVARERGQPVEVIPADIREQMIDTAIEDQKHSLDSWIDYLTSDDAVYPAWFKYFVWKNVTKLSQFDKERGEFKKRTATTVAPFPDIYNEPLAQIADIYEQVQRDNKSLKDPEINEVFSKKFPSLYAELTIKSLSVSKEGREEIKGEWIKYNKGQADDAEKLYASLDGKGTGWCTAGKSTAKAQVMSGDFYVFYTNDKDGNPIQPRLAIRMQGKHIGEIRGILPRQAVEPEIQDELDNKLTEFGSEADAYRKKSEDMRHLTLLEQKKQNNESFTKEDLIFLYEVNREIEGFGFDRDPRIGAIRYDRDMKADIPVMFDCKAEEIAYEETEVSNKTKVYIGKLFPGIFDKSIEFIYFSFPNERINSLETKVGGQTKQELMATYQRNGINVSIHAKNILESEKFVISPEVRTVNLVLLNLKKLGIKGKRSIKQIFKKATELGLDICSSDVGPFLRTTFHHNGTHRLLVASEPLTDRFRVPYIFMLNSHTNYNSELGAFDLQNHDDDEISHWAEFVFEHKNKSSKVLGSI